MESAETQRVTNCSKQWKSRDWDTEERRVTRKPCECSQICQSSWKRFQSRETEVWRLINTKNSDWLELSTINKSNGKKFSNSITKWNSTWNQDRHNGNVWFTFCSVWNDVNETNIKVTYWTNINVCSVCYFVWFCLVYFSTQRNKLSICWCYL